MALFERHPGAERIENMPANAGKSAPTTSGASTAAKRDDPEHNRVQPHAATTQTALLLRKLLAIQKGLRP